MHDSTLLKFALIGAVVGVALLFLVAERLGVSEQVIYRLDELPEGKEVEVNGVVLRVADRGNVLFMDIAEEKIEKVTVVLFKSSNVSVQEGDVVRVIGSLEEYQGKTEIIGNRLELK